jgi:pimeloyl-ACP methyl ester carboxylesterase
MPYLELDTARIYYDRTGAGAPPLMFVHGFTCAHDDWGRQVEHFAPRHAVVTCDLRAHGASSGDPQDCTIDTYGRDVAAVMDVLELPPAVLVGHSMGCRVVLEAYRQASARVAGLVLIDGSLLGTDPQAAGALRSHIVAAGGEAFARALFLKDQCRRSWITPLSSAPPRPCAFALRATPPGARVRGVCDRPEPAHRAGRCAALLPPPGGRRASRASARS